MSSDCIDVQDDIEQRIVQLSSRIYSHQNLINQYTQEKDRLQCILDQLIADGLGGGDSDDEGDDPPVATTPNYIITSSSTATAQDGPWQ